MSAKSFSMDRPMQGQKKNAFLKGIHYRSPFVYKLCTILKLCNEYNIRYGIAREYICPGESVLDVCAGLGTMKEFLPEDCKYMAIDASPEFLSSIGRYANKSWCMNLHQGITSEEFKADVTLMIISLCHFRNTSLHELLENFKKISKKVIIVEDVLQKKRSRHSLIQRTINYLTATDYFVPLELFTRYEFECVMREHQYAVKRHTERYVVGCYGF